MFEVAALAASNSGLVAGRDHGHFPLREVGSQRGQLIVATSRPAILDGDIPSLNKA